MRWLLIVFSLLTLFIAHIATLNMASNESSSLPKDAVSSPYVLPGPILKITSLEFDGILSDLLFFKGLVFIGINLEKNHLHKLQRSDWEGFKELLSSITDLDPYFEDPYSFGNAYLAWYAHMTNEANLLLEKGSKYRTWDWTLPFFIGFNYFYFLQDYDKAAEFLMEASRRPGASPTLASLASKLAFKAKKTENSIAFLEEMIKKTDDESMKKLFETRVEAFKSILVLENAVEVYRQKFRRFPSRLDELVRKNVISEIPKDPYGGQFSVDPQGAIKTTSESLLLPYHK